MLEATIIASTGGDWLTGLVAFLLFCFLLGLDKD